MKIPFSNILVIAVTLLTACGSSLEQLDQMVAELQEQIEVEKFVQEAETKQLATFDKFHKSTDSPFAVQKKA